jgi:hypothetical protein
MSLLSQKGEDWSEIGKLMGRSSDNVYDKYKHIGKTKIQRKSNPWESREFIRLLLLINDRT